MISREGEPTYVVTPSVYFVVALQSAVVVSVIDAFIIAYNPIYAPVIYPVGWLLIFGYTSWRVAGLFNDFLQANRPTLVIYIGCVGLAAMATSFLYLCLTLPESISMPSPLADGAMWRIKYGFTLNAITGVDAAAFAIMGSLFVGQIRGQR
jgi:hypothetical protein